MKQSNHSAKNIGLLLIIAFFCKSTLERGAKLCEKEECALMDTETLTIAMTVLSMVAQCKVSFLLL